jgi:probable O-glycosylation ligase (exosortase A-associated)
LGYGGRRPAARTFDPAPEKPKLVRSLALFLTVLGLLPIVLFYPFGGVLLWTWISLMNPHRLTWGFFSELPYALIIALATIVGWVISGERKKVPMDTFAILTILFMAWFSFTTIFALAQNDAPYDMWNRSIKTFAFILLTYMLTTTRRRIEALIWVVVISLGYFGVKGGLFAVLTGGAYRVWGPESSFIYDNNHLALALTMVLPLMYYLSTQVQSRLMKWGLLGGMLLTLGAIMFSYSRGALLACAAMLFVLFWRGRRKLMILTITVTIAGLMWSFAPKQWYERMESIGDYEEDASAQGRLTIWKAAFDIAVARPITGGGFRATYYQAVVDKYSPGVEARATHSIYFEVLGEQGFFGLFIFLSFAILAWWQGSWIQRATKKREDLRWANDLARTFQVALAAFMVGGAFLSLGYYDGYFTVLLIMAATKRHVATLLAMSGQDVPEPIGRPAPVMGGLAPPRPTYR